MIFVLLIVFVCMCLSIILYAFVDYVAISVKVVAFNRKFLSILNNSSSDLHEILMRFTFVCFDNIL